MRCPNCKAQIESQRSPEQNRGMYLYFTQKAKQLNDAGLDIRHVIKPDYSIPFTKENFRELIWIPIQKALYGTEHTRDLKKTDGSIDKIHKVIERELGEKHGVDYIEFPDIHQVGGFCGKKGCIKCNSK